MNPNLPNGIKAACGLSLFGGILSIAYLALFYESSEGFIAVSAFYMLAAVLFFALAGAFVKGGQWKWGVALLVSFLNIGVVVACIAAGYFDQAAGALLIVLNVCIVVLATMPASRRWLDARA